MRDLRSQLSVGTCFGTFLKLPRPEVVDVVALAGFDFVICDLEHAQISESEARGVITACLAADLPVVVRVPEPTAGLVNRLLEAGAAGIQMPRLKSQTDTAALVQMARFPPTGSRSVSTSNRQARYGRLSVEEYLGSADVLAIGQFESREIEHPIDPILDRLDVAFIGSTDLSVDMGVPGRLNDPTVKGRITEIEEAAKRTDTHMGAYAGSLAAARPLIESGYRYIAVSADVSLLGGATQALVAALHDQVKQAHPSPG